MSRFTRFILTLAVISIVSFVEIFAATAPSSQARYISFSNITANTVDITMVRGNGNNRIVVVSTTAITDTATFGVEYTDQGGSFTDGVSIITGSDDRVVDVLTGSQWQSTISNLSGGQTYYVKVFEYNKDGATPITAYNQGTGSNNPRSFTTAAGPVEPPTNLALVNPATATTADLSWADGNSPSDGFIFTLWVDQDGEGNGDETYEENSATVSPYVELDLGFTTGFDLTDLVGPSDYKYEVSAYIGNDDSESAYGYFYTPLDNTPPNVSSITLTDEANNGGANDNVIFEDDVNVTFTVTFSEAMKTWLTPTFAFSNTTGLTYVTGSWNNTVFTATFSVTDNNEYYANEDITITNAEDLAGNLITAGTNVAADVFTIDNVDGDLSLFEYATAGTNVDQPTCKSGVNGDVVEFEITLFEDGYNSGSVVNSNFVVEAEGQTNSNIITFSSTGTGGSATYLFTTTLNGTPSEDVYDITITFTDEAGNEVVQTETSVFSIDNTAPVLTIDDPITNAVVNDSKVIDFTVVEDGCGTDITEASVDGGSNWTTITDGNNTLGDIAEFGPLADGAFTLTLRTTDGAGNTDTETVDCEKDATAPLLSSIDISHATISTNDHGQTFTIDFNFNEPMDETVNPTITITGNSTISATPTLAGWTNSQKYSTTWGTIDAFTTPESNDDMDIVVSGAQDLAQDVANVMLQDNATGLNILDIDTEIPNVAFDDDGTTTPGDGSCVDGTEQLEITFSDDSPYSGVAYVIAKIDGYAGQYTAFSDGFTPYSPFLIIDLPSFSTVPDGSFDVLLIVSDNVGNLDTASRTYIKDVTGPVLSNLTVTSSSCVNNGLNKITFTFEGYDACSGFDETDVVATATTASNPTFVEKSGNGTSTVPYVFTYELDIADANGDYDITINADDNLGNATSPALTGTGVFTVDNTAPTLGAFTMVSSTCVNNGLERIEFTFTGYDEGCGTFDETNLSVSCTTATQPYFVDKTGTGTSGNPYVFTYKININDTEQGYDISAFATDAAGNISPNVSPAGDEFDVDNTAPVISALSVTPGCNNAGDVVDITFTITEAGCGTVDATNATVSGLPTGDGVLSAPTITGAGPYNFAYTYTIGSNDAEGTFTVLVDADDDAGNDATQVGSSPASDFSIDNTKPVFSAYTVTGAAGSCLKVGSTLEFTVDVVEAGCGTFDETDFNIGITPVPTNSLVADGSNPVSGSGTYKFTLLLDVLDTEGAYNLTFDGTDVAGNVADQYVPAGTEFTLDKTAPAFSAISISPSCIKGGSTATLTFTVTEAGCGTFNKDDITITDDVTTATNTWAYVSGSGAGVYTYQLPIVAGDPTGLVTVTIAATDDAGNTATPATPTFSIDNQGPVLSALTVTPSAAGGTTTSVDISFTVASNGCSSFDASSVVYTVTGPAALQSAITTPPVDQTGGVWRSTLAISNSDQSGNYHISVVAADELGNPSNTLDPAGVELVIDNTPPLVASQTVSKVLLNRADDDGLIDEFYIEVTYNEPLNTSIIPTLSYQIGADPTSPVAALTQISSAFVAASTTTIRYTYNLNKNSNLDMRGIGIIVDGARDVAGNNQSSANTKSNLFGIDFIAPYLQSLTVNNPANGVITDTTTTGLELVFDFSETMINTSAPTISFETGSVPNNATLAQILSTTAFPSISKWNLSDVYTAKFTINGTFGLETDDVAVGISNATDLAGNPFPGSNESQVFDVDTREPGCVSITMDPVAPTVIVADLDFDVSVKMDQTLDVGVTPTIAFTNSNANYSISGGVYTSSIDNTNDTYSFTVTHDGTQENVTETMSISGFKDTQGNPQAVACTTSFDVDTKLPEIVSITVSDDKICMDDNTDAYTIAIVFDEEMGATAPVLTYVSDQSAIFTGVTGGWTTTTINNDTYTFTSTLGLTAGVEAIDVDIQVSAAKDVLGNTMDADITSGVDKFSIDTKAPTVTGIAFNPIPSNAFGVNRSNIGAGGFNVVVTYDEAMSSLPAPNIAFTPGTTNSGTVGAALAVGTGSWTSTNVYTQPYTVNNAIVDIEDLTATVTLAADACGNVQASSTPVTTFAIDLIAPTCEGIAAEYSVIYEGQLLQEVYIDFSEEMSTSVTPTIKFANSSAFNITPNFWLNTNTDYKFTAVHSGAQEEIDPETVSLDIVTTTPTDLAGNPILVATCSDDFEIDTKKPTVESVAFTPTKVIGSTTTFSVAVEFNEDMGATVPTLAFSAGAAAFTPAASGWAGNTYTFNYTVADEDVEETGVTVTINTAEDIAGNVMAAHTSSETFNVDQVEPTIVSLSVSDALINKAEANNGSYTFTAAATFNEAMNTSANPTIAFSPDVTSGSASLTLQAGTNPAWSVGNTVATWTYTASDQSVAIQDIDITITGGEDACGNATDYTSPTGVFADKFSIDTENPTIAFDGSTPGISDCVNGTEAIEFTANDGSGFSGIDEVQGRVNGGTFAACTTGVLINELDGWPGTDGSITVELKALDLAGNTTTITRAYTADVTAPVISLVNFANTCVTTGDVINISFTITETGCGTILANNIDVSGFPNGNGVLSQLTITGNSPYVVTATYTVGSTDAQGVYDITFDVTDDAGNDATPSVNNSAFTIDKTAPSYSVNTPPTPTCTNKNTNVQLVINSDDDTFGCGSYGASNITASTNLGAATVTGTGPYVITVDLSGTDNTDDDLYNIDIVMTDAAGNVNNQTITNAFTLDNTAPALSNLNVTSATCLNDGSEKLVITFEVEEEGCGSFSSSNLTVTTGLFDDSSPTITNTGTGTNADPYIFTYKFDIDNGNGDADGDYDITVDANDAAGNNSTQLSPIGVEFTVDNTDPDIAFDEPLTGATVNGSKEILYTADDNDGCGIDYTEVRINSGTWVAISSSGNYLGDLSEFNSLGDVGFTLNIRSFDIVGNMGTSSVSLTKDATAPTVTSVTPSDALISIADGGSPFTVAVNFIEGMDQTVDPTVTLTANGTVANTNTGGSWTSSTQFTATFGNINGASVEEIADLDVTVSGAKDDTEDIGNTMTLQTIVDKFSIDTKAPTCSTMTNNNPDIYENDLDVTVTVVFSEAMSASPLPTFNITGTTKLTPGATNWTNPTTFTQVFTHTGFEEETTASFPIGNTPTDAAGNQLASSSCTTSVAIDTRKPIVQNIVFSTNDINENTTTFSIDVTFDENMDNGVTPTAVVNNVNAATIFTPLGSSGWVGNVYTFDYSVADLNVNELDVDVKIENAKDVAGNVMATKTSVQTYDIDQVAPVGTIDLASSQSDPAFFGPINFALTFNEDVTGLVVGDLVLSGTAGATTLNLTGSGSTYNVAVTGMSTTGTVIINLASNKVIDAAGNNNTTTILTDNSVDYEITGFTTVGIGSGIEPTTLSSLVDTDGEEVLNFDFKVTDDGLTPLVDGLATKIKSITISQGNGNDIGNWTTIIAGAKLTDGPNTVYATTINSNSIIFSGLANGAGQIGEVADDANKIYTLKVWLSSSPSGEIDNKNLAFKVDRTSFDHDNTGSLFVNGAGPVVESGETKNAIEVIATKLLFTTTPTSTVVNTNTTFVVDATDENGNRDVDYGPSTVTLTPNLSTISNGSGSMTSGTLTLNTVQFSTAFENVNVTASNSGALTNGVSSDFNIKEAEPASITGLSINPSNSSFVINFINPSSKNTLILAKQTNSKIISYSNEAGMDNETSWSANSYYGLSSTPSDASTFVIYAGSGVNTITMTGLLNNPERRYSIVAYAYAGALNSGVQNFNETETTASDRTQPKGTNYSENIAKGFSLGIDNITPQPANLNNIVSLQVETIEDMPLTLELYDSKGQKMMTLFEGRDFSAGETPFEFNLANTISSGQHFLRLTGNGHVVIAPMMIVK